MLWQKIIYEKDPALKSKIVREAIETAKRTEWDKNSGRK